MLLFLSSSRGKAIGVLQSKAGRNQFKAHIWQSGPAPPLTAWRCPGARRCSARCQLNNSQQSTATRSSSTPQIFCESFTKLYKECRGFQLSLLNILSLWRFFVYLKIFSNNFVFLTCIWILWKYKSFYTTVLEWYLFNLRGKSHLSIKLCMSYLSSACSRLRLGHALPTYWHIGSC